MCSCLAPCLGSGTMCSRSSIRMTCSRIGTADYLRNNQPPAWFSFSPRDEAKGLNRAHAVLAIQPDEAADFRARIARPVVTVGHAVALQAMPATGVVAGRILSVGSANTINVASTQMVRGGGVAADTRAAAGGRVGPGRDRCVDGSRRRPAYGFSARWKTWHPRTRVLRSSSIRSSSARA